MLSPNILRVEKVELIEIIKITLVEGNGEIENPVQSLEMYWTKDGKFIGPSRSSDL